MLMVGESQSSLFLFFLTRCRLENVQDKSWGSPPEKERKLLGGLQYRPSGKRSWRQARLWRDAGCGWERTNAPN